LFRKHILLELNSIRALLHCANATLVAVTVEACEERDLGGIGVLLSNPSWESRILRFLDLSLVGMVVEGVTNEQEVHAAKMRDDSGLSLPLSLQDN
jgi:hypothetical protein